MPAIYRHSRQNRWIALLGIAASLLWIGLGIVFAPPGFAAARHFWLATAMIAGLPAPFLAACLYLLLAVQRHRLTVSQSEVESRGILRIKRVSLDEVEAANWPGRGDFNRLVLVGASGEVTIEFRDYDLPARCDLVRFLRHRLPEPVQHGWTAFWEKSWRWFDEPDAQISAGEEFWARHDRRWTDFLFLAAALCIVGSTLAAWAATGDGTAAGGFALLPVMMPIWLIARRRRHTRGRLDALIRPYRPAYRPMIAGVVLLSFGLPALLASMARNAVDYVFIFRATIALAILLLCGGAIWQHRYRAQRRAELAEVAEEQYLTTAKGTLVGASERRKEH